PSASGSIARCRRGSAGGASTRIFASPSFGARTPATFVTRCIASVSIERRERRVPMPRKLTVQDVSRNMKICIYGPQGAGKTTFAATAQDHPDMKDVLFLDCEGGLMSVVSRGDIHYERIHNTGQLEEIFWKVANGDPEYRQFRTFVIDSVTELQAVNIEEVVRSE